MANFCPCFTGKNQSYGESQIIMVFMIIYRDSEDPDYDHELIYFPYLDCLEMDHPDLINEVKVIYPSLLYLYIYTLKKNCFKGLTR